MSGPDSKWCALLSCREEFTWTEVSDGVYCSTDCEEEASEQEHLNGDCEGPLLCDHCDCEDDPDCL